LTATKRVISGMRPTGRLHIGHYFGALQNWVKLQSDPANECFYFVADWHALTSDYADTSAVAENSIQITIDYLASGLDPAKSLIFLQSQVPEHAELHLLLSMVTPLGWLERIPTYKEQIENVTNKDLHTYGFLGYPTLQTADIVMYSDPGKSLSVPVGEDQVSHVEFSRELVRKFKSLYGFTVRGDLLTRYLLDRLRRVDEYSGFMLRFIKDAGLAAARGENKIEREAMVKGLVDGVDGIARMFRHIQESGLDNFLGSYPDSVEFIEARGTLTEPGVLLTPTPRIPGLDGRKMSKSYNNAITLSESDDHIRKKTRVMVTDPARKRRTDPGNPDVCPVYDWHKLFSTPERDHGRLEWVRQGCTTAAIGCIECKATMAENLIKWIEPIRARRQDYEQHPKKVLEILDAGSETARKSAKQTIQQVRESIFHWPQKRREILGSS
jgi:tryptophanyl-tRNA synthetase